ncbi:MAG: chalcone isomerase family protein [Betaproteobacteria bacterium]
MSRILLWLFLMLGAAPTISANVVSLSSGLQPENTTLRVLGQGKMRWFGLHLYDASLWVSGPDLRWDRPFALELRYARALSGDRLAEVSIEEMQRLGHIDPDQSALWRDRLRRAFPDVQNGSHITGVYRPGAGVQFYHDGRATALIDDPGFARAFFSIWLDPATRVPKLRAALLGRQ